VAKAKRIVTRREYTNADVKELRAHSKAKTPVAKIAKLTKRTEGVVAAEGDQAWNQTWPSSLGPAAHPIRRKYGRETEHI